MGRSKRGKDKRVRDVIDVRVDADGIVPPTLEQERHVEYRVEEVFDRLPDGGKMKLGKAHRRQARFERIDGLAIDQLQALRAYRREFDSTEASLTKSALDIRPRGAGGAEAAIARMQEVAFSGIELHRMERRVSVHLWCTLRDVALNDKDFSQVAIERFGGRQKQRIDTRKRDAKVEVAIEPRSPRHRQIIRDEFMAASRELAAGAQARRTAVPAAANDADPLEVDPAFIDEDGFMRPAEEIADIVRQRFYDALD